MYNVENTSRIITNDDYPDKTRVGYVRVSTVDQNEARQLEAFKDLNLYKIFVEKISTRESNRPMLRRMMEYIRDGDTVYIKDFSRLARSTKDLLDITESLSKKGVKIVSLKENLDTETPTGKLMLTLIGAIYEFERENILERQREGIAIAKSQGKFKGRKEIDRPGQWEEIYSLYKNRDITGTEAMNRLGLKRNTFYKFVKKEKDEDKGSSKTPETAKVKATKN
ncbi:MAG: recombinase family protein [Defluviitaleaceae bacterium]|nr:recombinase family protein [Defluviitaleaceae bacterium]